MSPPAQLFTRGADDLIDAIRDSPQRIHAAAGAAIALVRRAKVAVAARHGEKSAHIEEARASNEPVRDRPPQRVPRTADVANGGEAAIESVPEHASGKCR